MGATIKRTCPACGRNYSADATRLKHGRQTTCSRECSYMARQASNRATSTKFRCEVCGAEFIRQRSVITAKPGSGRFCSLPCRHAGRRGPAHPGWRGGTYSELKGSARDRLKASVVERDGPTCARCASTNVDLHHRVPRRNFDPPELGDTLDNVELLCKPHHRVADAELQRMETSCPTA